MFRVLATLGLAAVIFVLLRARPVLRGTTLDHAWRWMSAAIGLWTIAWLLSVLLILADGAVADLLWYATAVAMLCPFIAVLGGRLPTSRVWTAFVLVPLLLVLSLPAVTAWNPDGSLDRMLLEAPALFGYILVLLMGVGNYCGTRFTVPAVLTGAAVLQLVLPLSTHGEIWSEWILPLRVTATFCLTLAALNAWSQAARTRRTCSGLDRIWLDFRDFYGIVWSRRIQDRINAAAQKERWPVRLGNQGFVPVDSDRDAGTGEDPAQQIEHALRWLLRRFVDADWIDRRLAAAPEETQPPAAGDGFAENRQTDDNARLWPGEAQTKD